MVDLSDYGGKGYFESHSRTEGVVNEHCHTFGWAATVCDPCVMVGLMFVHWSSTAYEAHSLSVRKYLLLRLPFSDVDDAHAEVFEIAAASDLEPRNSQAWLLGVARNVVLRVISRRYRDTDLVNKISTGLEEESVFESASTFVRVNQAVQALPPQHRDVIELCHLVGVDRVVAAEHLGITRAALDVRLHRARKELRKVLEAQLLEEGQL